MRVTVYSIYLLPVHTQMTFPRLSSSFTSVTEQQRVFMSSVFIS